MRKKLIVVSIAILLAVSFLSIFPSITAENGSGYEIIGDSVICENDWGRLEIYPHTTTNLIRQIQYATLTWRLADNNIDVAFRFSNPISDADIWMWENISHDIKVYDYGNVNKDYTLSNITSFIELTETPSYVDYGDIPSNYYYTGTTDSGSYIIGFDTIDWLNPEHTSATFTYEYYGQTGYHIEQQYWFDWNSKKDAFEYTTYNNEHYYYVKNVAVEQDETYEFKWQYNTPINSEGKWDLMAKLSSDTIEYALQNDRYVMLDPWWNSDWDYYTPITIASSFIDNTLTNFPILISSTDTTLIAKCDSGDSIRFVDIDNSTEFYYEIESWSASSFNVWVNITTISSSGDTTILMYYGNSEATDNQNPTNVWHSNYITVHHMIDTTSSLISDSTSNNHDGSKYATSDPSQVNGKIDYAQYFDSSNDFITLGDSTDYALGDNLTISLWIKTDEETVTTDYYLGQFEGFNDYWFPQLYNGQLGWGSDGANYNVVPWSPTQSIWYQLAWSVTGNTLTLYLDSINKGTVGIPTVRDYIAHLLIGQNQESSTAGVYGSLDEIRISNIAYNSSWIETDYHSQNQTSGFLTFGSEYSQLPPNNPPTLENENPSDTTTDVSISITTLSVDVSDDDGNLMNWTIETSPDIGSSSDSNQSNGTKTCSVSGLDYSTIYYWYVNISDGTDWTNESYYFTTQNHPPNKPTCILPSDTVTNISLDTTLKVHVIDINDDTMTVSFYWGNDSLIQTITDVVNDTDAETSSLLLDYGTIYSWYAIANDSELENTSDTFSFTTIFEPYPPIKPSCVSPLNNSIDISISTTLKVHVIDMSGDTMTVSFYWDNDTLIETVTDVVNDTDAETSSLSLDYYTTYSWYVTANDSELENTSDTFTFTTGDVAIPVCEHAIPRLESDGYLYMIYRNGNINVSNLNLLLGSYSPFSVCKYNYTSLDWDCEVITINTNDYIRVKINESDMPYSDTLIPISPQIRFKITDADEGDELTIILKSNSSGSWEIIKEWSNVSEDWFIYEDDNMDEYNTTYYYTINVTDSYDNNILHTYTLTTTSTEPAIPPITPSIDIYIYGGIGVIVLMGLGGSAYLLSKKKRKR